MALTKKKGGGFLILLVSLLITASSLKADILGPLITETADPIGKHNLALQFSSFLFIKAGDYDDQGGKKVLPGDDRNNKLTAVLKPVYGLLNTMDLFAEIPYQVNFARQGSASAQDGGLADIFLGAKYRFWEGKEDSWQPSLTGIFKAKFPTGKYEHLSPDKLETDKTGNGSYEYYLSAIVSKTWGDWCLHFNLGYNWTTEVSVDGVQTKHGNIWFYNLAAEWSFGKNWDLIAELNGWQQEKTRENGQPVDYTDARTLAFILALGWRVHDNTFALAGVSFPLSGKNTEFGLTPGLLLNINF